MQRLVRKVPLLWTSVAQKRKYIVGSTTSRPHGQLEGDYQPELVCRPNRCGKIAYGYTPAFNTECGIRPSIPAVQHLARYAEVWL